MGGGLNWSNVTVRALAVTGLTPLPSTPAMGTSLRFSILGPLAVEQDGAPIAISGRRQRALLLRLLLARGRSVAALAPDRRPVGWRATAERHQHPADLRLAAAPGLRRQGAGGAGARRGRLPAGAGARRARHRPLRGARAAGREGAAGRGPGTARRRAGPVARAGPARRGRRALRPGRERAAGGASPRRRRRPFPASARRRPPRRGRAGPRGGGGRAALARGAARRCWPRPCTAAGDRPTRCAPSPARGPTSPTSWASTPGRS